MSIVRVRTVLLAALFAAALSAAALSSSARAQGLLDVPLAPEPAATSPAAVSPAAVSPAAVSRAALSALIAGTDPAESYSNRLAVVRELAKRFPGRISPVGHQHRELGLFAGIFMQTLWQHESGRDELPIWYVVNRNLTLVPRAYMAEYEAQPDQPYERSAFVRSHPTRGEPRAPITQLDTCRAWKDYFKAADAAKRDLASWNPLLKLRGAFNQRTTVTRKLWRAHTTGIRYALWQHADELAQVAIPEEELSFWRGWIRVVYFSEKLAPSTTDLLLKPFLNVAMPPCSPLGIPGCTVEDQPAVREAFLRWLMYGNVDQEEFLAVFGGKPTRSGAARSALSVMRDPDVAEAVRTGLTARSIAIDRNDEIILEAVVAKIRARRR